MNNSEELEGKVCVVTGAASGIGRAIAERLGSSGGTIALVDRDRKTLDATLEAMRNYSARGFHVDVSDEASVIALREEIDRDLGGADVLVNNAGLAKVGPTMDFALADWKEMFAVMVEGTFLCSREVGKLMKRRGAGSIINIASITAKAGQPYATGYSCAKAAICSMSQVLAVEWAGYGIRVNAIAPGVIRTPMLDHSIRTGIADLDAWTERIPMGRLGEPRDIAELALFLASDRSAYISGQAIFVDGGWTAFGWAEWRTASDLVNAKEVE